MKDRKLVIKGYNGVVREPSFEDAYTTVSVVFGKEMEADESNLVSVKFPKWLTDIIKDEIGAAEKRGMKEVGDQIRNLLGVKK